MDIKRIIRLGLIALALLPEVIQGVGQVIRAIRNFRQGSPLPAATSEPPLPPRPVPPDLTAGRKGG